MVGMTVAQKQVEFTVVVVVDELQAPTTHEARRRADAVRVGNVGEDFVLVVVIKRIHLLIDISLKKIDPAVLVVVSCIYSHSRPRLAEGAHPYAGDHSDLFELTLAPIGEEKIWDGIVRNV